MNDLLTYPKFAVVGHPNKGKSSIVASLAMDDTVAISDTPGTTTHKKSYPLKVDGEVLYELYDTPGFQRARAVLAWLRQHDVSADRRHEVVKAFIDVHRNDLRFSDEIELLEPIMEGAGIIYIVDASKPYGEEYEAEMEILRWTGQPSMALINHIDAQDYSTSWKQALGGYFQMIRSYNPMTATPAQHIAILESMAQLREEWTAQVKRSVALFQTYHTQMIERSSVVIVSLMQRALRYVARMPLENESADEAAKDALMRAYKETLRRFEAEAQKQIDRIWHHDHMQKEVTPIGFEEMDLFSEESASVFGLTRKELLITGITGGALTGAGIDLLFAGHTFFIGGAIGAVAGGIGAFMAFDELSDIKVLGKRLGRRYLETGPMQNRNFPYILLGRMLYYTTAVVIRSHAKRDTFVLTPDHAFKEKWLDEKSKKILERFHKQLRSGKKMDDQAQREYEALVSQKLADVMGRE